MPTILGLLISQFNEIKTKSCGVKSWGIFEDQEALLSVWCSVQFDRVTGYHFFVDRIPGHHATAFPAFIGHVHRHDPCHA